jgi:BirA family biotin operon repressor/biotin-[acetyl-CoA-carboxylase] ligase
VAEINSYGGTARSEIARRTGCPAVLAFDEVTSTMDVAHKQAESGAESGTLIVAERQLAGRGREGRKWQSDGGGVWITYLSRNHSLDAAQVLSIRVGLALRSALEPLSDSRLVLKWPNDIFASDGKIAGILVETRWREGAPEWTAIGIGINLLIPDGVADAAALRRDTGQVDVLLRVVPRIREAAEATGALSRDEVQEYMQHDMLRGKRVSKPGSGVVVGISEDGELVISSEEGIQTARSGHVVIAEGE